MLVWLIHCWYFTIYSSFAFQWPKSYTPLFHVLKRFHPQLLHRFGYIIEAYQKMLLVPPSHKFRKVKNETVESFMTTKDVVQRVQAAGWPCDHADSEMADGRADGHFGEILQAVAGGPLIKWAHRNWWLILLWETPFFGNTWNFSQNGHKRWNEDFDIRFLPLRKPNSGSPARSPPDHPGNQAAFAWVGEARCGRSGMFGGMSEFITCHIEQWTHVSPNRPQGGIWSKECLWFSKFARFFFA